MRENTAALLLYRMPYANISALIGGGGEPEHAPHALLHIIFITELTLEYPKLECLYSFKFLHNV